MLSVADALLGEKSSALKGSERAIVYSRTNSGVEPAEQENLALVQTILGEKARAISTLSQILQTPHIGGLYYPIPITAAHLRLDPIWDPLRADPAFQKICEEKQP